MFLVELAHDTIVKEIDQLQKKKDASNEALEDSKTNLQQDSVKLIEFIEKDQSKTEENKKCADDALNARQTKDKAILILNDKIQLLNIEIEKNKDVLEIYDDHREFLMSIYYEYQLEWYNEQLKIKKKKEDDLRQSWIALNMEESANDGSNGYGSMGGSFGRSSVPRRTN